MSKNILGVNNRFNRDELYRTLAVDRLQQRWEKQSLIFIFKLLHNLAPPALSSKIQFKSSNNYRLRNTNTQIMLPKPHTNFVRNSSLYFACRLFNNLPFDLRTIDDVTTFTKKIKKFPLPLT